MSLQGEHFVRGCHSTHGLLFRASLGVEQQFATQTIRIHFHRPLNGPFRGAVFHHGGVPGNSPLALMGRFPSLMGRFLTSMGRFTECLDGPFPLFKIPWKTAH